MTTQPAVQSTKTISEQPGKQTRSPTNQRAESADGKITLSLPRSVLKQLRLRMVVEETTIRALMLDALAQAGYAVSTDQIRDRRRGRTGRKARAS